MSPDQADQRREREREPAAGRVDSPAVTSLAGLDALFWLEEFAVEESSDPMGLDHRRVALLSVLADDVVLG